MSTVDLSVSNLVDDSLVNEPKNNILDNYDIKNTNYTKGIQINQCTFNGSNNFSIWDFSGYDPYKIFYDHFIGDQNCIHIIVYNLNQTQDECFKECVHWLEYLRSRIVVNKSNKFEACTILNGNSNSSRTNSISSIPSSATHSNTSLNEDLSNRSHGNVSNSCNGNFDSDKGEMQIIFIGTHADLDRYEHFFLLKYISK